jgi:flap endonuclease-1
MENGVKPIWVFDGKPPEMKSKELAKRKEMKEKAEDERKEAEKAGDWEKVKQMAGRSIRVTDAMMADAKKLVRLMGAPVVEAPCEAEAQCAELVKLGLAFATASEDMDSLTFGTHYLLRGFNSKKEPICQIDLKVLLEDFGMTQEEFVDLCILCGCDYTFTIQGMGPVTAFKLIKEHGNIEKVIEKVEETNKDETKKRKFVVPENFNFEGSRELFLRPDVNRDKDELEKIIVFDKPQEEELKEWLIKQKSFAEVKVNNGIERLNKSQTKKNQSRLDSFFKATVIPAKKSVPAKGKAKGGKQVKGRKSA